MRKQSIGSEEGSRIAQALFGFMGKARLYPREGRDSAIRIIEIEAKTESDPIEKAFFETAIAFIKAVDTKERAAHVAAYGDQA